MNSNCPGTGLWIWIFWIHIGTLADVAAGAGELLLHMSIADTSAELHHRPLDYVAASSSV